MKRFHVHAHVDDLAASVAFYSKLFGAPPSWRFSVESPRFSRSVTG